MLPAHEALELVEADAADLLAPAQALRAQGKGGLVTYSPKVFIPLTKLCRDVCHYCTFAAAAERGERAYLTADEVLAIARAGAEAGCNEALFTLGDKPERRYRAAREELAALGCETTIDYLVRMCRLVLDETGLLPHANPGVLTRERARALREVTRVAGDHARDASDRLSRARRPALRLARQAARRAARDAARSPARRAIPFTSGILIGIGETRQERIEALLAIREPARAARPRAGGDRPELPRQARHADGRPRRAVARRALWTTAAARLVLGPDMNVQAPPNLSYDDFPRLLEAGIDDWGGVSPVTIDHVNPEAPVARARAARGGDARSRPRARAAPPGLPRVPRDSDVARSRACCTAVLRASDALGLAREDGWSPGERPTPRRRSSRATRCPVDDRRTSSARTRSSRPASRPAARSASACSPPPTGSAARSNGDVVTYVVTRNINYTNVCTSSAASARSRRASWR